MISDVSGDMSDYRATGWFLNEWMAALGYTQASLARAANWKRAKMSRVCRGVTPYNREIVEELGLVMGLAPHELMLPPESPILRKSNQV